MPPSWHWTGHSGGYWQWQQAKLHTELIRAKQWWWFNLCSYFGIKSAPGLFLLLTLVGRIKTKLTPQSLTVHEGETALLICRTTGKPVEEIHWFKDRQPLVMTKHVNSVAFRYSMKLWYVSGIFYVFTLNSSVCLWLQVNYKAVSEDLVALKAFRVLNFIQCLVRYPFQHDAF